jgi:ribosomal protein L19E
MSATSSQIMLLRRLQQAGHKPVVLMGGGTTRIGDPTGKDEVRKMLSDETIESEHRLDPHRFRALPDLRRRPDRRGDGQQPRLARQARLHRDAAKGGHAFHRQPHVELRFGQAPAGARAADDLPRIQLHDPAGL